MKRIMELVAVAAACMLFVFAAAGCSSSSSGSSSASSSSFSSVSEPKQAAVDTNPHYVLVIGDDTWEDYKPGRADLMMLMRLDFDKHQVTLVSVPRDTKYVDADGNIMKLNFVYRDHGAEAQCKAVSELAGVDVSDYVVVGFDGFQKIVENFGGVDVDLPYALSYSFYTKDFPDEKYDAGQQTLTPWRAMALSRARTGYAKYDLDQDSMRQVVNRRMMVSLMQAAYADPSKVGNVLEALQGSITTNIPVDTQVAWAKALAKDASEITVYGTSGPFDGDIDEESQLFLVTLDPQNWKNLMSAVDAGQDPTAATEVYAAGLESPKAPIAQTFKIAL